jgi:hypothetical protein
LFANNLRKTMRFDLLVAAFLLGCTSLTQAAPATYLLVDHSTESLMSGGEALDLWKGHLGPRLMKAYPVGKWGLLTEVEGGFDISKQCVVTARAMMMPRSGKTLVFKPIKTATAFGAIPSATMEQCRALAKAKLGEAQTGMVSALLPQ